MKTKDMKRLQNWPNKVAFSDDFSKERAIACSWIVSITYKEENRKVSGGVYGGKN